MKRKINGTFININININNNSEYWKENHKFKWIWDKNIILILECSENKIVSLKSIDEDDSNENWLLFYIIL